jgi:C1A family cysteine protease
MEYGVMSEKSYPYQGTQGYCNAYDVIQNSKLSGFKKTKVNNHSALVNAVANFGAVSVGVEAGNLQDYKSGIFGKKTKDCGKQPNHAVVVIGYGGSGDDKYWIIQNSWSTKWGEKGAYRLYRDGQNGEGACGVQIDPVYATV